MGHQTHKSPPLYSIQSPLISAQTLAATLVYTSASKVVSSADFLRTKFGANS
jgi:hypothetical protein